MKKLSEFLLMLSFVAIFASSAWAKHFYPYGPPTTMRMDAANSKFILYGALENARIPSPLPGDEGSTDLVITSTVKSHASVKGKIKIKIPRYVPIDDPDNPPQFLIFADIDKGQTDIFRGVSTTPAVAGYLKGLLAIDARDRIKQLRYCFHFLEHADQEIAVDAYNEFSLASVSELAQASKNLPADKLRSLVQNKKTAPNRLGLYALLLGHCGTPKDALLLRSLIEKEVKRESISSSLEDLLKAYVLLKPKEGWSMLSDLASDFDNIFMIRYSALRTARFFYNNRPDVISQKQVVELYKDMLDQNDMADFFVEDLRKWKNWSLTDRILSLWNKKSHQILIIRRAIVRYALQCPEMQAMKFITDLRKTNPTLVAEVEETLQFEAEATTAEAGKGKS